MPRDLLEGTAAPPPSGKDLLADTPRANLAAMLGEAALRGLSNVAGIPGDITKLFNAGMEPVGDVLFGGKKTPQMKEFEAKAKPDLGGEGIRKTLTQAGAIGRPEAVPQTVGERLLAAGVEGAAGAALFGPAAMVTSAGGALAGEGVKEAGGGPVAQLAGNIAGSVATGTAVNTGIKTARAVMGKGGNETLQAMRAEGVTPRMAGDVADSNVAKQTTAFMRDAPVTGGIIQKAAKDTSDEIAAAVDKRASQIGAATTPAEGGEAITRGVKSYVDNVKDTAERFYGALGKAVPKTTTVPATNTMNAVADLTSSMPGLTKTSNALTPGLFKDVADDLLKLKGQASWQAMSRLRTEVGKKLADPALVDDIGRADLKQLYAALSDDMLAAATAQGPKAEALFKASNVYYRQEMQFVENSFQKLAQAGITPESLFTWATAEGKVGATRLAALRKAMGDPEFSNVSAVVLKRLGTAGKDGEFSPATFINQFERLSPDAKRVLFTPEHRQSVERIALIAKEMQSTGALANSSRTAGTAQLLSWIAAIGGTAAGGPVAGAASVAGTIMSQAALSKLLTSPAFAKWLATPVGSNGVSNHLKGLTAVINQEPHLAGDVKEFLHTIQGMQ